jgi:anaerobic magnesium-protoporphyrin IX monomethyl ester cyclase
MILFAHSNFLIDDPKQQEKMRPYAPLSTLLAAALVRSCGHSVGMFDATFEDGVGRFAEALEQARPRVVVIMEDNFNFLTKMCTTVRRETALAMIGMAREAGCRVAVNGPDASDNEALYLAAGADAIVLGEGEEAVLEVVEHWEKNEGAIEAIAGLILSDLRTTPPRRSTPDLDRLPLPAWDLIDIEAYRRHWLAAHGEFSWNIAASRGCPYACNWCAKPTFGRRYTVRSARGVVEEIARLKQGVAPDHLWFTDDILGLDAQWIETFAEELAQTGARIPFTMQSRVNLITERSVVALAEAGAREVWLGVETGSQKILNAMDKGTLVPAARTATRLLKQHGIRACWFIQLGYPSETIEDLLLTRDLIRDEWPDEIGVSVAYPLPGTEFYDKVRAQLGRQRHWKTTGELAMLFQGTFDTAFYRKVRDLLHDEARLRTPLPAAWDALVAAAQEHRSERPFKLAVGH